MIDLQLSFSWKCRRQRHQELCKWQQRYNGEVNAVNNINDSSGNKKGAQSCHFMQMYIICSWMPLLLLTNATLVQGAAVSLNVDLSSNPNFKPLCSAQQEYFIESDGKESSLILEFKSSGAYPEKHKSCNRILSAPADYGFIVRLILPKLRHNAGSTTQSVISTAKPRQQVQQSVDMTTLIEKLNTTALKSILGRTCPLSIFSSLDPHTPQWRMDPCQLEDTAPEMEDPVRLFHGRVRIVWEHGHHVLKSKLMVTALGKGEQCRGNEKHQCLKIGDEPILCISQDLVCDGIRHCPYSNEYDSDEDYNMCWKHRRFGDPLPPAMESDIFEHFALEVFRNLFAYDPSTTPEEIINPSSTTSALGNQLVGAVNSTTTLRKVNTKDMKKHSNDSTSPNSINETEPKVENSTDANGNFQRRNSTRNGLHSDLSKYGPWGYLMLGMLLCGGALLICGLWASASQHAVNNEREAALAAAAANGVGIDAPSSAAPPNYEELDPPPAYSVLFPNQKAASSNTLNVLDAATPTVPQLVATTAVAAFSGATNIMTAQMQLEQGGASSSQQRGN